MAKKHVICSLADLPSGSRKIVTLDGQSVGVFNVDGSLHALLNYCPHHGAPLCQGRLGGTMLESDPHEYVFGLKNQLIRCPWHGFEYRLATGQALSGRDRGRAKVYPVRVEDGRVVVET